MRRRNFLQNTFFSTAGLLFSWKCAVTNSSIHKDKLGVALLGLGSYSTYQLAPALQLTNNCYLAGIVTGSPEKMPLWQEKYNIPSQNIYSYDNMDELADNPAIDVVYIVTPTATHARFAIAAANAGKHVWCEKPMAMTVTECQSIIDACKKNKVQLSIGYRMQHEPNTQTLISYAKSKPFGNIKNIVSQAGYAGGGGKGWRHQKAMGGGALYDMGVYTVNGMRYATGLFPKKVISAKQYARRPELFTEVDEFTEYTLEFENGIIGKGKTSVGETMNLLHVNCQKGHYELSPMQAYNGVKGSRSDGKLLNIPINNQQAKQMDDDALAILQKQNPLVPGKEGLLDIRIINAIIKAAATGREVVI